MPRPSREGEGRGGGAERRGGQHGGERPEGGELLAVRRVVGPGEAREVGHDEPQVVAVEAAGFGGEARHLGGGQAQAADAAVEEERDRAGRRARARPSSEAITGTKSWGAAGGVRETRRPLA